MVSLARFVEEGGLAGKAGRTVEKMVKNRRKPGDKGE